MSLQELQLPVIKNTDSQPLRLPPVPDDDGAKNEDRSKVNLPDFKSLDISRPFPDKIVSSATTARRQSHMQEDTSYNVSMAAVQEQQKSCTTSPLSSSMFPVVPSTAPRVAALTAESEGTCAGDADSVMSVDEISASQRAPSVSMDDPDVRIAAEALSGLGNPGSFSSNLYV